MLNLAVFNIAICCFWIYSFSAAVSMATVYLMGNSRAPEKSL